MCSTYMQVPTEVRSTGSPGAGVRDGYELPDLDAGNQTQDSIMSNFTIESSLHT